MQDFFSEEYGADEAEESDALADDFTAFDEERELIDSITQYKRIDLGNDGSHEGERQCGKYQETIGSDEGPQSFEKLKKCQAINLPGK